jgi:hypothetical protein
VSQRALKALKAMDTIVMEHMREHGSVGADILKRYRKHGRVVEQFLTRNESIEGEGSVEIFTEEERGALEEAAGPIAERMSDEARELQLYIDNDGQLYRSQTTPIHKNLMTKRAQGRYDTHKAVKLFMYLVDAGAKKYAKEHGSPGVKWNDMFPKADRLQTAKAMVSDFEDEAESGSYDDYIPKKYRK